MHRCAAGHLKMDRMEEMGQRPTKLKQNTGACCVLNWYLLPFSHSKSLLNLMPDQVLKIMHNCIDYRLRW